MSVTKIDIIDDIALLKLNRGITNALNLKMISQIKDELNKMKNDPSIAGIVLTSSNNKFFVIGFDIPELFDLPRDKFYEFYHSFNQLCLSLYTYPKPIIAAITGHATAGGCILALCCDYRYISEGKKFMGLNEIKLGVPVPYPADCILQNLIGIKNAREITDNGEFYLPDILLQIGLVDKVLPLNEVINKSIEKIKAISSMNQNAFSLIKRNRVEEVEKRIITSLDLKEKYFIDCWYSKIARTNLEEAIKKF